MSKCVGQVTRKNSRYLITLKPPKDIITYWKHTDGVDHGYQHSLMGSGFVCVAYLKKWQRKTFLVLNGFIFLQVSTAWDMEMNIPIRGGKPKFRDPKKWEFYSIAYEKMMKYVGNEETKTLKGCKQKHI